MAKTTALTQNGPSLVFDSDVVLADMSVKDLELLNRKFMRVRSELKVWQSRIAAQMSRKQERQEAQRKLAEMTPDAREHLKQAIMAEGVPSKESVNG
jgi:hypothetical protein